MTPVLLALALAVSPGHYRLLGVGNTVCSGWTYFQTNSSARDTGKLQQSLIQDAWLAGFVSAYNDFGMAQAGDVAGGLEIEDLELLVSSYCRRHPDDTLGTAAGQLIQELERRRSLRRKTPESK